MLRKKAAAAAIACCLLLSGCDYVSTGVDTLVRPPNLSEEQEQIYDALETTVQPGSSLNLVSPENGSNKSAVIFCDMDSEATEEALAFYSTSSQSSTVDTGLRICLLDQIDGEWRAVWDIPGEGSDIDKVLFFTDNSTAHNYVLIGFSPKEDGQQKTYCIYDYEVSSLRQCATGEYQMLEVFDIDGDGQEEIITVSYREEKSSVQDFSTTAVVIDVSGGQFVQSEPTTMAGKAISYNTVTKDTTSFGVPALVIDEQVSKTTYATEILIASKNGLQNLIYQPGRDLYDQTIRTQVPISYDINKDGVIEIPQTDYFPGYSASDSSPLYISKWYQLHNGSLKFTTLAYANYSQGYGLLLPDSWEGRVSATNLLQNDELLFFVYHGNIEDQSEPVLSIKTETVSDIAVSGVPEGYFQVATIGQMVYLAKLYPVSDGTLALTQEQVINQFVEMYVTTD